MNNITRLHILLLLFYISIPHPTIYTCVLDQLRPVALITVMNPVVRLGCSGHGHGDIVDFLKVQLYATTVVAAATAPDAFNNNNNNIK